MNVNNIENLNEENQNVVKHSYLTDDVIDHFQNLITAYTSYKPYNIWQTLLPVIEQIPRTKKHLQILFSSSSSGNVYDVGHWVCSFYDTESIFIFDSLNQKRLHTDHEKVLKVLHPYYFEEGKPIVFPNVQRQTNSKDCGVFAIAFAVSLLFGIKPNAVSYKINLMRSHLLKMLVNKCIEHFPSDLQPAPVTEFPRPIYNEQIIIDNACLNDLHIDYFQKLIEKVSLYKPCSTLYLQNISKINEIPEDNKHIQILFQRGSNIGHWICTFYDTINLIVYDSLNSKTLSEDFVRVLSKLHPYCFSGKKSILFPTVQSQQNATDCGVFAIAFAISVLFGYNPEELIYHQNEMRSNLLNLFRNRSIKHFPCYYNKNTANSNECNALQYHFTQNYHLNDNNTFLMMNKDLLNYTAVENKSKKASHDFNINDDIIADKSCHSNISKNKSKKASHDFNINGDIIADKSCHFNVSKNPITSRNIHIQTMQKLTDVKLTSGNSIEKSFDKKTDCNNIEMQSYQLKKKNRVYYELNKQKILEKRKLNYNMNKDEILSKRKLNYQRKNEKLIENKLESHESKSLNYFKKIDNEVVGCKSSSNTSTSNNLNKKDLECNSRELYLLDLDGKVCSNENKSDSLSSSVIGKLPDTCQRITKDIREKEKKSLNREYYECNKKELLKKRKLHYNMYKDAINDKRKLKYQLNSQKIIINKSQSDENKSLSNSVKKNNVSSYCKTNSITTECNSQESHFIDLDSEKCDELLLQSNSSFMSLVEKMPEITAVIDDKEKNILKDRKYYELNKKEILKKRKLHDDMHKDEVSKKRKLHYQLNNENIRKKQKQYYTLNKDNILKKSNLRNNLNRQRNSIIKVNKIDSNQLNTEKILKSTKNILANKIRSKYKLININQNTNKLLKEREKYIKRVMEKLSNPSLSVNRMEAETIVSASIYTRDTYISELKKCLKSCKDKIEISLTRLGVISIEGNEKYAITALCGTSKHSSTSEAYFADVAYNFEGESINRKLKDTCIILNEKGMAINILPIMETNEKSKIWKCNEYCRTIDADMLKEIKNLFEDLLYLTFIDAYNYLKDIDNCSAESRNHNKLGHPNICYAQPLLCKSKFLKLNILAIHYPKLRTIKRQIYKLKHFYELIEKVENALNSSDIDELRKIASNSENLILSSNTNNNEICLNEVEIKKRYSSGIKEYTKLNADPPTIPCISCERLCCKRNVQPTDSYKNNTELIKELLNVNVGELGYWTNLKNLYDSEEFNNSFICKYCLNKFKKNSLPSTCILNNLFVKDVPKEIKTLNMYEKMLIQRAKAFQTIIKMDTVMKKNLPHYVKIDKVKGRTFHLPLPLEETLKKICPDSDALNTNQEIFILLRSHPTKQKVIWENLVDIKKVWTALHWLKCWNPLYGNIIIPSSPEQLLNTIKDVEIQYEDMSDINNENKPLQKADHKTNPAPAALLTQKSQSDSYYDQYSIYPLHAKTINETDTKLYQMLQVYATALDVRGKDLDLKCFPDLYPFGINGQHEDRPVRLRDFDYIRSKLTSKHPQFRSNIQYLFYLLFNNNIRQISGGIYQKLNVVNPRFKYTAKELLEKLEEDQLETNLQTIFSRLRGTEAYWRQPRNDLDCMINEHGPVTLFVTLSPGEWMWSDLAEYIREVNDWDNDKRTSSELIAVDPVSASRFIRNKFLAVFAYILSSAHPIGKVNHYYYACEYQGRGLPHYHCLFWIDGAPIYGKSPNEEVKTFILQNITCRIPDKGVSPELYRRVMSYQQHKHNNYCMRKKKTKTGFKSACRFGFPRPVTKHLILRNVGVAIANRKKLKNKSRFYDLPRNEKENCVNDYMPALLVLWEGNNDAQYIGESSYLLTKYVSSYGTKGEKSVVDFTDINSNKSLCSRLWSFSLRALNHRECGAIEAADTLLGHPLHAIDPHTVIRWLDVRMIRNRKLKPFNEIKKLEPDSTDLFCKSFIDNYYPNRPKELEKLCLYDFAKWFDIVKKKPIYKAEYYEMGPEIFCKKRKQAYLINHWKYNPINQPESYYYALLLLFQPWRDLDDLKGCEDTYTNAFLKKQNELAEAMKYHDKNMVIQEAMENMNKIIQNELLQESNADNQSNSNNLPEGCVPIEVENAMKDYKDIAEKVVMNEKDLEDSIQKFNEDQSRVFHKITSILQSDEKILRIFISGPGGTGKSFIIENLVSWNKIIRNKETAVTAPTGIAAYNIQGLTIHRLLQLPVEQGCTAKYKELSNASLKQIRQSLQNVDLIIIDEISMVSNIMLMYIHLRLTEIFATSDCNDGWFGKKHIILFGDLLQLPPVHEEFAFKEVTKQNIEKYIGAMNTHNLWSLFDYDELTINMRQRNDKQYNEILSRVRLGFITDEDSEVLQKRVFTYSGNGCAEVLSELCTHLESLPNDTVCLLPTRNMCNILNSAMLRRINSEEIKLVANDTFKCSKTLEKKVLKMLNEDNNNSFGVDRVITIKINSKVMIRRNIDVSLGLVNGTIGTVISVCKDKADEITSVCIKLQTGEEHSIQRLDYKLFLLDKIYILRQQFPICNSYGITIHKSQGLSLENAVVEAGNSIFSCGQTYVALSRVTKIEGLHLINFDPSGIKVDESAILEYNRLRETFRPDLNLLNIPCQPNYKFKDTHWAILNDILSVQNEDTTHWNIIGLPNEDNVSCFANASIQSLFHSDAVRRILVQSKHPDTLKSIFNQYISKSNVNVKALRDYVDMKYSLPIQQDVPEFLMDLCNKFSTLQIIFGHELSTVIRCPGCDMRSSTSTINYILSLCLTESKRACKLQDIIDSNIGIWHEIEGSCNNGCKCKRLQKVDVSIKNTILIVQLLLFTNEGPKISKIKNFKINEIPKSKITINKKCYRVVSGIFHHGNSIHHGHYTNMLRQSNNQWIKVNDSVVERKTWPKGAKDIYVLFLERA